MTVLQFEAERQFDLDEMQLHGPIRAKIDWEMVAIMAAALSTSALMLIGAFVVISHCINFIASHI